jgi:hypothetical protein
MSISSIPKASALYIPGTGPQAESEKPHLFVILTNPCPKKMQLLVPVCSAHRRCDTTCLLDVGSQVGDYKKLNRPSYIDYSFATIKLTEVLIKRVNKQDIEYKGIIDANAFAKICAGLLASPRTKPWVKVYFSTHKSS